MFLVNCLILSVAFVIFIFSLLSARNPNGSLLNKSMIGQICVSVLLTGLFSFGFAGVVSRPVSVIELAIGGALVIALVFFYRLMRVKQRLAAFAAAQQNGQVVVGDFTTPSPANKPAAPYRKAA